VLSTASAVRYDADVPILVPGVNLAHAARIDEQRRRRGWQGFIAPLPNCTTMGLVITLKPLLDRFGIQRVVMTSMQGVSGAGLSPGVAALEIFDNVIPYIPGEEEKVARETGKILDATFPVSATCTRAAVTEGHTEAVTVSLGAAATPAEVAAAFREFGVDFIARELPSSPRRLITVHDDPFRPQPRLDRDADGGMTTSVGRIRPDVTLEHGTRYVLVSHNTKMGAAKGAVLAAEWLVTEGYI
jgi:aspartate-semialdehyde dehydrogenase